MDDKEQLRIIIRQMLEHINVHLEEYEKWTRFAETNHMTDAGALLDEAKHCAKSEYGALRKALDHIASI
jgi:hypothetical protein